MIRLPGYHLLDADKVALRAILLGVLLQKEHFLAASHHTDHQSCSEANQFDWEESQNIITFALSKDLRSVLISKPNTYDPVVIRRWAIDQLAVLLWSLGVIDKKPLVEVMFTEEELMAAFPIFANLAKFIRQVQLRSITELFPVEVALDLYSHRAYLFLDNFDFDGDLKERTLERANELFDTGYLVSPPVDDLVVRGQRMADADPFEVEQISEMTERRTNALFFVFGKMGK